MSPDSEEFRQTNARAQCAAKGANLASFACQTNAVARAMREGRDVRDPTAPVPRGTSLRAARRVSGPIPRGSVGLGQCLFLRERTDRLAWIKPDRGGHIEELQHVQSPIAPFVLCDVGRRFAEPLRDHGLRQPGRLALGDQQLSQLAMTLCVDGLGQWEAVV
jgi:hypothetical protein